MRRTLTHASLIPAAVTALTLIVASGMASGSAAATAAQDEFTWDGTLAAGRTLEIKSANGEIHAEAASGDRIEVRAVKEGPEDDRAEVTIEVVEHEGGVTICAMYPSGGWFSRENECTPDGGNYGSHRNKTRVDFEVRVPAGVNFKAESMNGEVVAEDIGANVIAHSMNGAVRVSAAGHVEAGSMNGAVTVAMGRTDWRGTLEIDSMNGRVSVELPADASTEVEAETMNGSISSDWPSVEVEKHRWVGRSAEGTIGSGGRKLVLDSMNGSIEIRRRG